MQTVCALAGAHIIEDPREVRWVSYIPVGTGNACDMRNRAINRVGRQPIGPSSEGPAGRLPHRQMFYRDVMSHSGCQLELLDGCQPSKRSRSAECL